LQNSTGEPVYRKVAVVENFFDIIYNVHVELEGRPGKHAGQKRTYRTVSCPRRIRIVVLFRSSLSRHYRPFQDLVFRNGALHLSDYKRVVG
jgi:hypothetical protein